MNKLSKSNTQLIFVMFVSIFVLLHVPVVMGQTVIQIDSIEELQKIGNDPGYPLDGEYELTQDIDASDTENWNNGAGFNPIGTDSNPFTGKFDGKGHKITGIYINPITLFFVGLFGYTGSGSEVKNLGIENCRVWGYQKVGSLVGENNGTVTGCYSTGLVSGGWQVGGFVGRNNGTIVDCYSTSSISGYGYVGGLVGWNYYGTISGCYSAGSVSGVDDFIGGLIGNNYPGTVTNSYWDKQTSGQNSSAAGTGKTTAEMKQQATYVGWDFTNTWAIEENISYPYLRILGPTVEPEPPQTVQIESLDELQKIGWDSLYPWNWNYELMVDIDASETINWNGGRGFKPLLLTGKFDGKGHRISNLYINQPNNSHVSLIGKLGGGGEVKNLKVENCKISGMETIGSLVGLNLGTVNNCFSTGLLTGLCNIGGLVGVNYGTIYGCYSSSTVLGTGEVGGLVGHNWGTASTSCSRGSVLGKNRVGGLVGGSDFFYFNVNNCYSACVVSGISNVGGLVGYKEGGTVSNSYWDIEVSGQSNSMGGIGKTTAEMKKQATFAGWDFTNVWAIEENVSYPYLRALGQIIEPEPLQVETLQIDSLEELQKIGWDSSFPWWWNYELMVDIDASETVNWDGGKGFRPILLIGKFDGKGHKISNLYINRPDEDVVGLICTLGYGGELKDLGIENCQIMGRDYVGGLLGISIGTVSGCYSTGSVWGDDYVGGLVGFNSGTVSNSYAMGSVEGSGEAIGGLIGRLYLGSVTHCYSTGAVGGSGSNKGGLIGYVYGSPIITSSYWDTETSGMSTSAGGTGKTTAEMKQQATYAGWDFTNVWGINEGSSYPYLLWQGGPLIPTPDVVGLTQSNAESTITGAGLTVGTVSQQCSNTVPAGNVISQNPSSGTQVSPGTAVNIIISTGECVTVPDVVGLTQSNAESAITGAGLTVGTVTEQCSNTMPEGSVVSQYPTGGEQVSIGTTVELTVSAGPCPVSVPNVVDMTQSNAESAITGAGLTVGTVSQQCSNTVPAGNVISQNPSSGTQVSPGTAIDIVVSNGPCPVSVPNVVGMTQSNAESAITGAGLTVGTVSQQCSNTVPAGNVISQNPSSGTLVSPGTAVNIVVSTGLCPIQIDSIEELQKIGNDAGYPLNGNYELTQDIDASDTVNWNGGAGFAPIGTLANPFTGNFDGKGHKITGLYINRPSGQEVGLFGCIGTGSEVKNLGIENCYVVGYFHVGGLSGYSVEGIITNCYSTGTVSGYDSIGMLLGGNERGSVLTCYSMGAVSGDRIVGGLIGWTGWGISLVSNCYSTASATGITSKIGGLVGWNYYSNITKCYSKGAVSGGSDVGGLVGNSFYGTTSNSYWDVETSGRSSSAGGTGKTTAEMKQQATFVGWDFVNVWGINEGSSYPYLLWQGGPLIPTPDVVGLTQSEAESAITGAGLSVGTITLQCSDVVPAGSVISQDPPAGQQVSPGTQVDLVISTGACPVPVPDVVGMTQSNAESAITGAGLTVGTVSQQCSNTVPAGNVISQNPSSGTYVSQGTAVNIIISTGECVTVPDVVGLTQSEAESAITGAGLTVGTVSQQCSNTVPAGNVISQNPSAGQQMSPGTVVNIVVSIGECVSVPDVFGMTQSNAESTITGAGLTVGTVSQECSNTVPAGNIISQNPSASQQVPLGTAINIVVSAGECVTVPEVVGLTQTEAENTITEASLTVGTITGQCSNTVPAGNVISQAPSAGVQVPSGAAINIVISTGLCPIQIDSIEELQLIGNDPDYPLDREYELTQDIDASDTVNWNNGMGFAPIGTNINPFLGKFDGKGHKITNLYINREEINYVGLFSYIDIEGELKNLGVKDCYIKGCIFVGGLIGANAGTVANCYSMGTVSGVGNYVGGLAGINYGGIIESSYSTGEVLGSNYVGGLLGHSTGIVRNNYSMAEAKGNGAVGGLLGYNSGSVLNCYSTGAVSVSGYGIAGGLIGLNYGPVTNSYWDIQTSGLGGSGGGEGKTTAEMRKQETYVNWDFENIWGKLEDIGYPYLLWQESPIIFIPNVVGFNQTTAEGEIIGAGLAIGTVIPQCSNTVPEGNVISQNPNSGTQASPGTAVNIVISIGLCPVSVPNIVGLTQSNAESTITGAGLTVGTVSEQCSDTVPTGCIISQNPTAWQQVPPGTAVNIVISIGPCIVSVPNVVGKTQAEAETSIAGAGLTVGTVSQQCSNTVPVGNVISQNPTAGQQVSPGTAVNIVVSTGPCPVSVPYVVGKTQAEAETSITGAGLTVGTVSQQCSNTVPVGNVISQNPTAGQQVSPGTAVNIVVSTGPCPVTVPYVVGKTQAEAETSIAGAGLTVGTVSQQCSNTVPVGNVISQNPTAGQQVSPGTAVNIVVSTGPCLISVPNVVGKTQSEAETAIAGAGLTVGTVSQQCSNPVPAGKVISQNPTAGQQVSLGTAINIVVSTGPCPVSVPNVVGKTQTEAEGVITVAGLNIGTVTQQCSDTVPSGKVISQNPTAGQQVSPGTAVNIVVSTGPCPVSVPDVVGKTQTEAESAITGVNLTVGTITQQCSDTVPKGNVISQNPTAGQQVSPGTAINIVVSIGPCLIQIDTIEKLQKIGNDADYPLNINYELTQDIDASDTVNWNNGAGFLPIGIMGNPFAGKFDGKGYKITGLYINMPDTDYVGLFGYISSGSEIRDLGLEDFQILGNDYVGGLVGVNKGTVLNCYSVGTVTANGNAGGGLVGVNVKGSTITNCYSTGSVEGYRIVGGLLGVNDGGTVSNCYNTGTILSQGDFVGGLIGYNYYGTISNCYNTGSVRGARGTGGLVGSNYYGTLSTCFNTGSVLGTGDYVGGVVGYNNRTGKISDSYNTGAVEGVEEVGGMIGQNDGTVSNCYSRGSVAGSGRYVGGLIGYNNYGTVSDSYWNIRTSGQSSSDGGIGKLTVEMRQQATYVGWDFATIWGINEGISHPYLLWQGVPIPEEVSVPDVFGMTQEEAESTITKAGLSIGTISEQCDNDVSAGKVISQTPSAGQQVLIETAVSFVISTGPCPVSVPDVTGKTQTEAESSITGAGLTVGTVTQQCSNTVPAGNVISQDPTTGQQVSPGTAVNIVVSTGLCPVTVLNVVGMTQSSAESAITSIGLTVSLISRCDNKVPADRVISQMPSAGQQVAPGTQVTLFISTGPCNVIVPNVVGRTEEQARGAIEAADLIFSPVYECSDTVLSGYVIRQNPLGNTGIEGGSTVTVWISTGLCTSTEAEYNRIWAYAGIDHVYVFWEGSIASDLLGYRLYRSEDNKKWTVIAGTAEYYQETSYRDYEIISGKTYWYKVEVTTSGGGVETLGPVKVEMGRILLWIPDIEWRVSGTGSREIHVPVNIGNAVGLKPNYMNIDVSYDTDVLDVVRVEKTAVSADMQVYYNTGTTGLVKVGMAPRNLSTEGVLYGEGHLFDMVFKLKGGVSDGAESRFEFVQNKLFDKDGNPVAVEVRGGRLVVQSLCMRGDINGDEEVLMVDAGLLLKRIAKRDWDELEYPCLLKRGDINGDGILDVADVSMLMRWSVGLAINPPQSNVTNQKDYVSYMKMVGSDTEVKLIGGSPSGEELNEFGVGLELSSLGGLGGLEVVLGYGSGLEYKDLVLDNRFLGFNKEVSSGVGYVRVSLSSKEAIAEDIPGRVLVFKFKVSGASGDKKETRSLQIREVRLKGVYGDDFRWYGEVKRLNGVIEVCPAIKDMRGSNYDAVAQWLTGAGYVPDKREENNIEVAVGKVIGTEPGAGLVLKSGSKVVVIVSKGGTKEQLLDVLQNKFGVLDENDDDSVSWEEISGKYDGLTKEVFNEVDTNKDGKINKEEAGLSEGGTDKKCGCGSGCNKKSLSEEWWKYIVDFVLFGMVLIVMSGMQRRRK